MATESAPVQITEDQEQRLKELVGVFLEENRTTNLSAFRTEENCWKGNVLDSLAALDVEPFSSLTPFPPLPVGEGVPYVKAPIHSTVLSHARSMRKEQTEAEELLWEALRDDQLGVHFRRQHPIHSSILDFYCHEAKLGIELDGPIHLSREQKERDTNRTENLLHGHGIYLLRFKNEMIFSNLPSALKTIRQAVHDHLPSPRGGGAGGGGALRILDLGTGGGFPMLPLAMLLPHCTFVGLDSIQKKVTAVERMIASLKLTNAKALCGRAEEIGHDENHREHYDTVLCRAVAEINVLLEYAVPLAKVNGFVLLWKSLKIEQELKNSLLARAELSCHLVDQHVYELPEDFGKRQILVFRKTAKTREKYPREVGEPKKHPLQ